MNAKQWYQRRVAITAGDRKYISYINKFNIYIYHTQYYIIISKFLMGINIRSAGGIIALLEDNDPSVKFFALKRLDEIVNVFWHEISEYISKIEEIYEDSGFQYRELAALIASKVYYHLEAFDESVNYALCAGRYFNIQDSNEYIETIIAKCIDLYIKQRVANAEGQNIVPIDSNLVSIVDLMFKRCFDGRQYKQALGIALETRRMDIFEKAIMESDDIQGMLSYALKASLSLIQSRNFRNTVHMALVKFYKNLSVPDYINVCQCLIFLDEPNGVADILEKLINKNEDGVLLAYQIGFDMYESATQQFLQRVQTFLKQSNLSHPNETTSSTTNTTSSINIIGTTAMATNPIIMSSNSATTSTTGISATTIGNNAGSLPVAASNSVDENAMDVDIIASADAPSFTKAPQSAITLSEEEKTKQNYMTKLLSILNGDVSIELHLQFLIRANKTDPLILKNTKDAIRNSVCHNATVVANSFMNCGTTSDQFLRDNLEWLARATNWAKFTATSSLGSIHKGHEKEALHLMSTYLPKDTATGSAYSEGGGLYALGLIHANHGGEITEYLLGQLRDANSDTVRHGACLGLGLAALGTARDDIYEQLKLSLFQDDAVTGEAAGLAMGLVKLGTATDSVLTDMITYAQETQHEKILRGLAVGIALVLYGRLEDADAIIDRLATDKDPILRWAAAYSIGTAYCGTGDNGAIRKLLHTAVSDTNDDVRRAAVCSIGFLLFRTPEQCPNIVSLLSESYNPHVRYGSAMALGIACAGTGLKEALALLDPMTNDPVNYVRQGALVASALILVQHNDVTCPKASHFRQLYAKVISDKHEDVMAKFGAIFAQGIIDAGGRNLTISLQTRTGHTNMNAIVGLLVFLQFWYWYPLSHFLSLALSSSAIIGLNIDLNMPKVEFRSNAKPSTFAYVAPLEEKKDKSKEKVETAVLSITARHLRKRDAERRKDEKMETEDAEKKEQEKKDQEKKKEEEKKKDEAGFDVLQNPARVIKPQLRYINLMTGSRYVPMKDIQCGGMIVLKNLRPKENEDLIEIVHAGGPQVDEETEPEPPEPFEWSEE